MSDFTKGELTVYFKIASITKEYKIDSLSLTLQDTKSGKDFMLKNIQVYGAKINEDFSRNKFKDFNALLPEKKVINETIRGYYAIDHIFLVPNVDDTKDYRIDIKAKFTTKDSSYNMTKTILFNRSKHFTSIRWSGC